MCYMGTCDPANTASCLGHHTVLRDVQVQLVQGTFGYDTLAMAAQIFQVGTPLAITHSSHTGITIGSYLVFMYLVPTHLKAPCKVLSISYAAPRTRARRSLRCIPSHWQLEACQ